MRWSSLIDINNDWIDEIFLWGWAWQSDQFFRYQDWKFLDVSSKYTLAKWPSENTLAAASADVDWNGYSDLIVSRDDSVIIYHNNNWVFRWKIIDSWLNSSTSPLWITLWDIDRDGDLDMYIAWYIKRELMNGLTNFSEWYWWTSVLLINDGIWNFENKTEDFWLLYTHNTFQWVFVDLNNDSWLDLVVAHDTWEPRIYKNREWKSFELKTNPFTNKFSYPMGIALWDYDNDGFTDIMFSNIWSTLPKALVKWDLPNTDNLELGWFLLKNNWDFNFEDTSQETAIQDYEFSWWAVFADMNNDAKEDLIVAENYVDLSFQKLFKLPWRFLLQRDDGIFVATGKQSWASNKHYWITPLISDFNRDGVLDLVWVNIAGPSYAFINNNNVTRNYIQISLEENPKNIGSKIVLTLASWETLTQDYIIWEWLAGDQSSVIHFWLWEVKQVSSLDIMYTNWETVSLKNPEINTTLKL